jgi:metal-responsive CopG/Arc/MetJ family transcriptional regulator
MAKRATQVVALSVPPESVEAFERMARDEGRNKSELFREMLRVYRAYRETGVFETLQRYGAARARAVGVHDEGDVERLVQEARGV